MVQWNVNVPADGNERDIEVFVLTPVISLGGLVPESNLTVCPTDPKAKVTVPPGAIVTVLGENARAGVAAMVAVAGGVVGVIGWVPPPDDPHATTPTASEAETMKENARCIIEVPRVNRDEILPVHISRIVRAQDRPLARECTNCAVKCTSASVNETSTQAPYQPMFVVRGVCMRCGDSVSLHCLCTDANVDLAVSQHEQTT